LNGKRDIQINKSSFKDIFSGLLTQLSWFSEPIGESLYPDLAHHLHSHVMNFLPLKDFQHAHRTLTAVDAALVSIGEQSVPQYCIPFAPEKIRPLFSSPGLFVFAIQHLKRAAIIEIPLEALAEIAQCFDILAELYTLEVGTQPTPEDLAPLVTFTFLICKVNNLVSVCRYIEHYLGDLAATSAGVMGNRMRQALSQCIAGVAVADRLESG
jgi:hypothetical protein